MARRARPLLQYGAASQAPELPWSWVERQLADACTYWVVARGAGHPHPRPVWGVWDGGLLAVSLGSPSLLRAVHDDPVVTVHLDSGTDVVIVEGLAVTRDTPTPASVVHAYDRKYDWQHDLAEYGDLTTVAPVRILAWRAAGPAGRDGFSSTGCWVFDAAADGRPAAVEEPEPAPPEH